MAWVHGVHTTPRYYVFLGMKGYQEQTLNDLVVASSPLLCSRLGLLR
jgi:hypothetical protein